MYFRENSSYIPCYYSACVCLDWRIIHQEYNTKIAHKQELGMKRNSMIAYMWHKY